jgi:hypothetical protein
MKGILMVLIIFNKDDPRFKDSFGGELIGNMVPSIELEDSESLDDSVKKYFKYKKNDDIQKFMILEIQKNFKDYLEKLEIDFK